MADNLRFKPGTVSDPLIATTERAGLEHAGHVRLDLGSGTATALAAGTVPVRTPGAPNIATNQGSVTTSSAQLIAARTTRRSVMIVAIGTTDCYIGIAGVTTGSGLLLIGVKGATITLNTTAAIHAVTAAGSQSVSWVEEYD